MPGGIAQRSLAKTPPMTGLPALWLRMTEGIGSQPDVPTVRPRLQRYIDQRPPELTLWR